MKLGSFGLRGVAALVPALLLVAACSGASADPSGDDPDGGGSGGGDGGVGDGDSQRDGADGGSSKDRDGSTSSDGGDGGPTRPPTPTVGTVTGFALLVPNLTVSSIACAPAACYIANYGAPTGAAMKLTHGAASLTALPDGPRMNGLTAVGSSLYGTHFEGVSPASWPFSVYELNGSAWTRVGLEQPSRNVYADTLRSDGTRLFQTSRYGLSSIPRGAGPNDAWVGVGTGSTMEALSPQVDSAGNLYASMNNGNVWKLAAGKTAWVDLGVPGYSSVLAPNDDLWVRTPTSLTRLAAGTTTAATITLPPGASVVASLIIDGSNTAYFPIGKPQKLYKVPSGGTMAMDTGVTVSATRTCGRMAIDGSGKLLIACDAGFNDGTPWGLWRSTP